MHFCISLLNGIPPVLSARMDKGKFLLLLKDSDMGLYDSDDPYPLSRMQSRCLIAEVRSKHSIIRWAVV